MKPTPPPFNPTVPCFGGVDPGFTGAVAIIHGDEVRTWDLPTNGAEGRKREFDLLGLEAVFYDIPKHCDLGIEYPTTRPEDLPERMQRFGIGQGLLWSMAHMHRLRWSKIPPQTWKARLGVDGKQKKGANEGIVELLRLFYPKHIHLLYGPRGGLKDGRLDALAIAHYMRIRTFSGAKQINEQYGKNSDQALTLMIRSVKSVKSVKKGSASEIF